MCHTLASRVTEAAWSPIPGTCLIHNGGPQTGGYFYTFAALAILIARAYAIISQRRRRLRLDALQSPLHPPARPRHPQADVQHLNAAGEEQWVKNEHTHNARSIMCADDNNWRRQATHKRCCAAAFNYIVVAYPNETPISFCRLIWYFSHGGLGFFSFRLQFLSFKTFLQFA